MQQMMKSKYLLSVSLMLFIGAFKLSAQNKDTLRVMNYNLLYYNANTSFCTQTNNNLNTKEAAMEDIIDVILPDVLVVNEIGTDPNSAFYLSRDALNKNGRNYYRFAANSGSGQTIANMLFYNRRKLQLESQRVIDKNLNGTNIIRDIDVYTLRYKDTNLAKHGDTIRFHIIVAHLKAGNTTSDRAERGDAVDAVMADLDSLNASGNYIIAGDFNLYRSTETAYQELVNYVDTSLRFYDPVRNMTGLWNQQRYAAHHTQSTRTSGGCGANGGMNDRFDLILYSDEIKDNTDNLKYIRNSYKAYGQDGLRYNSSINSPRNNLVGNAIANALRDVSDHLPVILDLEVTLPQTTALDEYSAMKEVRFTNPIQAQFFIDLGQNKGEIEGIEIMDIQGRTIERIDVNSALRIRKDLGQLSKGTYLLKFRTKSYQQFVEKLIKI